MRAALPIAFLFVASPQIEHRSLPPGIAAEIDGKPVSVMEYGEWLARYRGDLHFGEFLEGRLVRERAAAEGVSVTPEEVAAALEAEIAERVENAFRGERDRWVESEITRRGRSLESFRRERGYGLETELLVRKMLWKERAVTEEDVRARWEEKHGREGRRFRFRQILLEVRYVGDAPMNLEERDRRRREVEEQVRQRCLAIRAEIVGGLDFAHAARAFSDDAPTREAGGDAGEYTPFRYGPLFEAEIWKVEKGRLSDPIRSNRGWHLVEITEESRTDLESVADELRRELETRAPFVHEVQAFLAALRSTVTVVR